MGHGLSCARTGDEHNFVLAAQLRDLDALGALLVADAFLSGRATLSDRLSPLHIAAVERSLSRADGDAMDVDGQHSDKKLRTRSRSRSKSRPIEEVVPGEGLRDTAKKKKAIKKSRDSVKNRNKEARRGEADRVIPTLKPKHLFSGKRGIGKTSRR